MSVWLSVCLSDCLSVNEWESKIYISLSIQFSEMIFSLGMRADDRTHIPKTIEWPRWILLKLSDGRWQRADGRCVSMIIMTILNPSCPYKFGHIKSYILQNVLEDTIGSRIFTKIRQREVLEKVATAWSIQLFFPTTSSITTFRQLVLNERGRLD